MGSYNGRGPAGRDRKASGICDGVGSGHLTRSSTNSQTESLTGLGALRAALDQHRANGGAGDLPQPGDFGLVLGNLTSSDVFWRSP
jgi:hypothetical protein